MTQQIPTTSNADKKIRLSLKQSAEQSLIKTDELKPEATKISFENCSQNDRAKYMDSVREVHNENVSFSDKNIKIQRKELKEDGLSNKAINKTMLRNIINAKKGLRKEGKTAI